ncbi:MAG: hypothetical protein DME76_18035 [Verrucomicrobia bacterium]|nr:MAG: hypothetical protein DME76_18035 [Verrucomicrobiota bacterium]
MVSFNRIRLLSAYVKRQVPRTADHSRFRACVLQRMAKSEYKHGGLVSPEEAAKWRKRMFEE